MPYSAVFLDRDGVINCDKGYVYKQKDLEFIDGIFDLVRFAYAQKYKIIVMTNKVGIARDYYAEYEFHQLTEWMCQQFSSAGTPIDRFYFSPFHPTAGVGQYLKDDNSRKPHPDMVLQAREYLAIELSSSLLVGDKVSDIQAGISAGIGANLLLAAERFKELNPLNYEIISTLLDAIPFMQRGNQ
jgi:D-glycero-D-manno-heptose 1,7-bisphosphate phosphatase